MKFLISLQLYLTVNDIGVMCVALCGFETFINGKHIVGEGEGTSTQGVQGGH